MNLKEEIDLVVSYEKTKKSWRNKHNSKEWKLANKVASVIMLEGLNKTKNCGCLEDLFIMLKSLNNTNIKLKENQMSNLFQLKDNKVIMLHNFADSLNNANITDEKAIALLKKYPAHISSFSSYPPNWKELVAGSEKLKAPEAPEAPAEAPEVSAEDNAPGSEEDKGEAPTREEELLATDIEVLRKLAADIAEAKGIKKASHMSKQKGLTKYILENE